MSSENTRFNGQNALPRNCMIRFLSLVIRNGEFTVESCRLELYILQSRVQL